MCIPGVSENKAIGVVKVFPTLKVLMDMLEDKKMTEKEKKGKLMNIEI
jgi:hypothetical protein